MSINHRIELVNLLPYNSIAAEVGVAQGLFSADLLDAGVSILYSIDNWNKIEGVTGDGNFEQPFHDSNYKDATERLSKYGHRSLILKGMSADTASKIPDNYLDLVYLDGAHYYDGVMADLKAYHPKLKSGGVMAGHDYLNESYGVRRAVNEFCANNGYVINVIEENKPEDASFYFIKK